MHSSPRPQYHPYRLTAVLVIALATPGADVAAQQRSSVEGDWAGWIYLTAGGDTPFRLHVAPGWEDEVATLDLPANRLYGDTLLRFRHEGGAVRFSRTSSSGSEQSWVGELKGGMISGAFLIDGERVGRFDLHRSALPLPLVDPEDYADCTGVYRFDSGRTVVVSPRFWGELLYLDTESGRFATLFPTSDSTFFAGSAMYVPDTVRARATCRRETGRVASLLWYADGDLEIGARVRLTEEVVEFKSDSVTLRGTLIRPQGAGPIPAAVVLGGSSWRSRGSLRADADILASIGMAVLIYDKRGFGESTGTQTVPFEETADDAIAAVRYLRERDDIDPSRVGLTGRSRGGWFAPLAASRDEDIAFLVLFVAPAVSPAEQETTRRLNVLRSRGHGEREIAEAESYLEVMWHYARTGEGWEKYAAARNEMEARGWLDVLEGPEGPEEGWDWARMNMFYDPVPALSRLTMPVLALYGAEDRNVVPEINVPILRGALREAGNENYRIVVVPEADHSLRLVEEPDTPLHRRVGYAPEVWGTVLTWVSGVGLSKQ